MEKHYHSTKKKITFKRIIAYIIAYFTINTF